AIGSDTARGLEAGAAYVFRRDAPTGVWSEEQKLVPSHGGDYEYCGRSVALADGVVVIGAPTSSRKGSLGGAAYVFRDVGGTPRWDEEAELLDANGIDYAVAGTAVATDGTTVYVAS